MLNDLICPAGKFCPEGSENALLDCEEGYYCPKGTDQQLKCFPGTYNTQRGKAEASDCVQCDAGFYCTEGMATSPINNASMLCDEGYYCPKDIVLNAFLTKYDLESGDVQQALNRKVGSWGPKQFPCPGGTYRDTKGAKDDKECTDCSATKYCPEGSPKELDCPDGYVCGAKTEVPIPCPKGTYHDTTATRSLSSIDECTDCTEGMYCDGEGLTAPRDKCDPGYICFTGSPISNPLDIYGSECPAGGYCEQGSSELTPCPDGTFSNASRATTDKECVDCRPGLFCDPAGSAIIEPTGGCLAGYYCTEKSKTPTQNSCGPGTFCEELSSVESSCTFGTFNPSFNNDSCVACDEGSLCDTTSLSSPGPACPEGSFCPSPFKFINPNDHTDIILINTSSSYPKLLPEIGAYTPVLCPPGTYGDDDDKKDETTCVRCPEGKACFHFGMTSSDIEDCEAGFMCGEGNIYKTPSEGDGDSKLSGPCEPGHYCPAATTISGSTAPKKCQPGTFNPNKFGKALDDCLPCLAGMACTIEGLEWPDAECEAGYYCTAGASSAQQNECTFGHYCPPGSNKEKKCPVGYYQKELGQSTCTPCPAGKLCPTEGMDDPQPCVAGSFCLGTHCEPGSTCDLGKLKPGTRQLIRCGCEDNGKVCGNTNVACYEERVPTFCPIGYYGVGVALENEGECTLCDPGKYCDEPGMTSAQQKSIGKGHFSSGGARVKYPVETIYPDGTSDHPDCLGPNTCGLCEKGYFCNQEGLTTATPDEIDANKCPKFTFSNQPGYGEANCITCPAGYDCNTKGISELTDDLLCEEHFTCTNGGASKIPCEEGKYCPRGSSEGLPCTPGYFCEGASTGRQICPAGTYCEGENAAPEQCPPGYNCPVAGTYQPLPCQPGYYQDQQGQIQCELCSATKYCPDTAMSQSSDDLPLCDPGYICTGGAKSPKQEPCEEGTYKDSSMDSCQSCPDGKYCPNKAMSDLTEFDCLDGFVCNGIVNNESPRGDKQCTPGHYCEKGFEYECPSGTFRLTSGSSSIDYCVECTPGFICPNATVSPAIKCPPGFFCPLGTGENEQQPCTSGHFCPEGSDREILCPKGTLCSSDEMAEPDACTPGELCDELGQTTRKDCPEGYKCPVPVCTLTDAFDLEKFHQYTTLYACDDDIVPEFKIPCGKGYYNDQLNQEDCKLCPEGKFCPFINTITPEDCVAGFDCVGGCKMSTPRTESIDCVNPPDATSTATFKYLCPKGYYCEPGQPKKPCLAGTYNPMEGAVNSTWCLTCPTGSTCDEATGEVPIDGTVTCEDGKYCTDGKIEDCPKGFYCDYSTHPGRSEPYPCPEGTFNDKTGLSKVEECSECTAGYYCDRQAMTQAPETLSSPPKCQAGFYCPIGSKSRQDTICPVGSFCQEEVGAPSPCPPREYTSSKGQEACKGCPERFMCPGGTAPIPCPAGEYCGAGVSSGAKCPAGTWSNVEKLAKESECMACPPGKMCKTEGIDDETKLENCPAGYWCQHSVQVDPTLTGSVSNCDNGKFGKCAAGFMCPEGSSRPIPCSAGTYQENEGQESCEPCLAGEFCFEGASVLETNTDYTQVKRGKCPVGYYCPSGTKSPYDYPCRKGTYADLSSSREDDSACKICDAGSFCGKEGLELPSGLCTPGFYCPEGSTEATAKKCGSGNYCPEGSKEPLPCPAGKYCPGVTMSDIPDNNVNDPIWDCWPGYYCLAGSKTPNPSTGKCKKGFYCPAGSDAPKPCDAGTYLDFDLAFSPTHCKPCKPGYLCSDPNLSQPYEECSEGFYCVDNVAIECEAGYYCPKNSGFPRLCESGTYSAPAASSCKACDAGKYCDPFETGVVVPVSTPKECPPGYYCPSGTKFMYEYPCPAGKIRRTEGAVSENDCDLCPAGSYCKDRGLSAPTGDCYKGYECPQGQIRPNPSDHKCPAGHYCDRDGCGDGIGTPCPVPCPANTYNDMPGATMLESCQPCTKACSGTGNIQDGDACAAGQDCEFDPPVPCPKGYYCPENETYKVECPPGTFRNELGGKELSDCTKCTAGTYCPNSAMENVLTESCDDGYDCQTGAEVPKPSTMVCPIGVYCKDIGKAALCTNGETTVFTGADDCHTCPKGYDCVSGSEPVICPIGFYCVTGTPVECPSGTVGKIVGLTNQSECSPCPSGKVCPGGSIENECPAGKYCRENASEPATNIEECPAGYECPLETGEPKPCSAGFFSERSATSCTICPEKFYCEGPKDKQPCPLGYVCPEGTEFGRQFACPKGSYSNKIISDIADCISCDEFHYCEFPGQDKPTGRCDDGYRCESGESSPTPEDKLCLPGHYCEAGEQLRCKAGFFCPREGMTPADLEVPTDDNAVTPNFQCNEGYYCDEGTRVGNPGLISSDERCASGEDCGGPCEPGHYCPRGTEKGTMQKCKKGTYYSKVGARNEQDCIPCLAGYTCDTDGLADPTLSSQCEPGFYCPGGNRDFSTIQVPCKEGHKCPGYGNIAPIACEAGYYQMDQEQDSCDQCDPGYYCPVKSVSPQEEDCPDGFYCPAGTQHGQMNPCPIGTIGAGTKLEAITDCAPCPAGKACPFQGYPSTNSDSLPLCAPGIVCPLGGNATHILDGEKCEVGHYCEAGTESHSNGTGSKLPIECPTGTYNDVEGAQLERHCKFCKAGSYCDSPGATQASKLCKPGFYCPMGSTQIDQIPCPEGHYCEGDGNAFPEPCPTRTFQTEKESVKCDDCTEGFYCNDKGLINVEGVCKAGYYCPTGSKYPTEKKCPAGAHCPAGSSKYTLCDPGSYAPVEGMDACIGCPPGFICDPKDVVLNFTDWRSAITHTTCILGHYCEANTTSEADAIRCPDGTYSEASFLQPPDLASSYEKQVGLKSIDECTPCPAGFWCDGVIKTECNSIGDYCQFGARTNQPTGLNNTCGPDGGPPEIGGPCTVGNSCESNKTPFPCEPGFFQDEERQEKCKACPDGNYCPAESINPIPCESGYSCENDKRYPYLDPCPAGTFDDDINQQCQICPEGKYCDQRGLNQTQIDSMDCLVGFFCGGESEDRNPYVEGRTKDTPSRNAQCVPGEFCPHIGLGSPEACPEGEYCETDFLNATSGECAQGFACPNEGTEFIDGDHDVDSVVGNPCGPGVFCTNGTDDDGSPCPETTYNNGYGLREEKECTPCLEGFMCEPEGLDYPTTPCADGQFCVNGTVNSCPEGYACNSTSPFPLPCYGAHSSDNSDSSQCGPCNSGETCMITSSEHGINLTCADFPTSLDEPDFEPCLLHDISDYEDEGFGVSNGQPCPKGSFCEEGKIPTYCPPGTYNDVTGGSSRGACKPTDEYHFSQTPGSEISTGDGVCADGFYCVEGSSDRTPQDPKEGNGGPCTPGFYCNSGIRTECPAGTYTNSAGAILESDCYPCDIGHFCKNGAITPCDDGKKCFTGIESDTRDCIEGRCEAPDKDFGPVINVPCSAGEYWKDDSCQICPAGSYCNLDRSSVATTEPCLPGSACPEGTAFEHTVNACKIGQYSQSGDEGLELLDCVPCDPGHACTEPKQPELGPECLAGFYCNEGSKELAPYESQCETGHYCADEGMTAFDDPIKKQCPPGTFNNIKGASSLDECVPCPPGYVCESSGIDELSFDMRCPEGSYCPEYGTQSAADAIDCPIGYFCPTGSSTPRPCEPGTFGIEKRATDKCADCEAGYYCNGTNYDPGFNDLTRDEQLNECPLYHYCEKKSAYPTTCKAGTYNHDKTGLKESEECDDCPPGVFCTAGRIADECLAGYVCKGKASNAQFEPCKNGFYCPAGSKEHLKCPTGLMIVGAGKSINECDLCPGGSYCDEAETPTVAKPCNPGHYCLYGRDDSDEQEECPLGTYNPFPGGVDLSSCLSCPPGSYCNETGIGNINQQKFACPEGFFCPGGQGGQPYPNDTDTLNEPIPCPPGTYGPLLSLRGLEAQDDCEPCPKGFYCPEPGMSDPSEEAEVQEFKCQPGTYCPEGSSQNYTCPAGFFCENASEKVACPAGTYCPPERPETEGNDTTRPEFGNEEPYDCPIGSYCPISLYPDPDNPDKNITIGCMRPIRCQNGYAGAIEPDKKTEEGSCTICPPGTHSVPDRSVCEVCRAGTICQEGATTDSPLPKNITLEESKAYLCPPGYYCPEGAIIPIGCPPGTYGKVEGLTDALSCSDCPENYFTHLSGQQACLSCGGQARQPTPGSSSCLCQGSGREFQPSDRQCVCKVGYAERIINQRKECIRQVYDICRPGTYRAPEGDCKTKLEFDEYCTNMCSPRGYNNDTFDKELGICNCADQRDLDEVCNYQCRSKLNQVETSPIVFKCSNGTSKIMARVNGQDDPLEFDLSDTSLNIINSDSTLDRTVCEVDDVEQVIFFMSLTPPIGGKRLITGSYEEDAGILVDILDPNRTKRSRRQSQTPDNGIDNPIICLEQGQMIFFEVDTDSYPVYDETSLLNTNEDFDFGGFRLASEMLSIMDSVARVFAFRFDNPGTYVFYIAQPCNDPDGECEVDKTQVFYITVNSDRTSCPQIGPFFPATSRYGTLIGARFADDIYIAPDWLYISVLIIIGSAILGCLVWLLYLFRKYGWTKWVMETTFYRWVNSLLDIDQFVSKGSARNDKEFVDDIKEDEDEIEAFDSNRFFDYGRVVHLEDFDTQKVYRLLLEQSTGLISGLNNQKSEAKGMLEKFKEDVKDLKTDWIETLDLDPEDFFSEEEKVAYFSKKKELDNEILRRKNLAASYGKIYNEVANLFENKFEDIKLSSLRIQNLLHQTLRSLSSINDNMSVADRPGISDLLLHHRNVAIDNTDQMYQALDQIISTMSNQCLLNGSSGYKIGITAGGFSPFSTNTREAKTEDIVDATGEIIHPDLQLDEATGLILLKSEAKILENGEFIPCYEDMFFHPQTLEAHKIAGNILYDAATGRISIAVDSAIAASDETESLIPLLPYPRDHLGNPLEIEYLDAPNPMKLKYGTRLVEKSTGLAVPVLAITVHPKTGLVHALGASALSNVTSLRTPIERYLVFDDEDGTSKMVNGLKFDADGKIVPSFFSSISVTLEGGLNKAPEFVHELALSNGSYWGQLEATKAACLARVLDSLDDLTENLSTTLNDPASASASALEHFSKQLTVAVKHLNLSTDKLVQETFKRVLNVTQLKEKITSVEGNGGVCGLYEFDSGNMFLPILIGEKVQDTKDESVAMPILDVEIADDGNLVPVFGTTTDPFSGENKAIELGDETVDATTAEQGRIVGASRDKKTNTICPTVQVGSALNPAKPPFGSVSELQNHITTVNSAIEKLVKASETVSSTIFQETESKMTINEGLVEIKSVLEEMISVAEDVEGSMEIDIVSTLGKLMSNDVLYYLDQIPTDVSNHAKDLSALAGEMKQTMNKFKTRSQANLVRNSLSTSLGKFRFEMMKLNQSQVLIRQQQILAESRLVTDFGTRAESNMYYHGLFVNVHVSTRDEMLPVLKKLAEYLEKGLSMYLTPEMVEYLESACAKLKSREVDEVITNIKEKVEEIHVTTDAQPAVMTSNDENERDEKAILIHEGNQQKMRIENAERYREAIEKLESEREAFIDENILEVQTISKNDEEFNAQADHFSATLAKIDDDLQRNNRLLAEETARNTKRSSDQARPDGAEIYLEDDLKADLSEIEALERKMLDEIDGFEDYVEEANEDLADKLKGLNFEFSSKQGDEVDNIINECSDKIRKRKGRRDPCALLETEHDLTVMYEQLKKAAENDPEAQRLLSELDGVFDAHILARNEAKRKHKDRLEALARQRAARMAAARKPDALTNDINGEVEEVNKSSTVTAEEAKIQELENEFNEKINEINKSCHKDSDELDEQLRNRNLADDMIKDLKIRMAKVEKNRQRQIKAAIALRTAKLQAAKRRKATAEASEVMQSMANISDLGDVTEEDIRNQILEEVTNGKDANQAVKDVLQARHRQEILDMSRRHQCEIEAAKKVALNEARDARYLDRNSIVEQFDRDVLELSTRDIDDAEYDAEFKRLKAQLTAELKAFDEETERLGDRIFNEKRKGLDVKQSAEHLGLLERQLSQIDEEIRKCTSDAQIQYELQQNRLKAQQKHQAAMDEAARQKALEEEERLRQQQEDLLNKKNRLKSDKQSEKERQKAAEEAEKARLEAMVLANEERARVKLENERIQIESSNKNDSEKEKLLRELDAKHAKQAADRAAQTDKARSELEKRLAARRARAAEYTEEESLAEEEISETPAQILIKSEQPQQQKSTVDHSQVLLKSGLIEDLSALEAILKASISLQTGDNSQSAHSDLFLAKQDQLRKTSPGLVIIHPSDLSTLEFVGYRLFQRQFELLSRVFHLEPISIMIANEFPAQEERKSFAPSFYSYQNGIALLDQQHLKSSGLMSVMAAHLASHLAADSHFIDSDVVFKRTFFRAVSLLCAQIPAESLHSSTGEEILDYTSKGQKLREAKYKEHLRNAPQASSHIKHQRNVTENKAKTTQKLGQELKHDIVLSGESKNSSAEDYFDRLCAQMFEALQEEDEDRIQALQKKLEAAAL